MLCSPSCSASLSERFAPLREIKTVQIDGKIPRPFKRISVEAYFISSSLMSSNLLMLGNFSCISFFTPRLMPTGTTFRLLQVGNTITWVSLGSQYRQSKELRRTLISAFTLKASLNSHLTSRHHLSPKKDSVHRSDATY